MFPAKAVYIVAEKRRKIIRTKVAEMPLKSSAKEK